METQRSHTTHTTAQSLPQAQVVRVLQLCTSNSFGGLEIHFNKLSHWLRQYAEKTENHLNHVLNAPLKLSVWVAVRAESRLAKATQSTFTQPALLLKGFFWQRLWQLLNFIRQQRITVIHCHHKDDLLLAVLAKKLSRHPITLVHTRHMQIGGPKRDPYHTFLYENLDLFIAITQHMRTQATQYLTLDSTRIQHMYLGVPPMNPPSDEQRKRLRQALSIPEQAFLVATIARVEPLKGQHVLVEAIAQLHAKNTANTKQPVYGLIVGETMDEAYATSLKHRLSQETLPIIWLGFRNDIPELIAAADAVCITTRDETFGLIAVEAMMSGRLTIGADSGGILEIITPEKTGILYETFNANSLAETLARVIQDPEHHQNLAKAGQQDALERFAEFTQFTKLLEMILSYAHGSPTQSIESNLAAQTVAQKP